MTTSIHPKKRKKKKEKRKKKKKKLLGKLGINIKPTLRFKPTPMIEESRQLVTCEPVEFEE
jgi:hypothetical protein